MIQSLTLLREESGHKKNCPGPESSVEQSKTQTLLAKQYVSVTLALLCFLALGKPDGSIL